MLEGLKQSHFNGCNLFSVFDFASIEQCFNITKVQNVVKCERHSLLLLLVQTHSIFIGTVSSQVLFSALPNWLKMVYILFWHSKVHRILIVQAIQEEIECTKSKKVAKILLPNLYTGFKLLVIKVTDSKIFLTSKTSSKWYPTKTIYPQY